MKKRAIILPVLLSVCLTGCASAASGESVTATADSSESIEEVSDVSSAVDTLSKAADRLNDSDPYSLQLFGTMSQSYKDSPSYTAFSSIYKAYKKNGVVDTIFSTTYQDGTIDDAHYLSDGTNHICYLTVSDQSSVSSDTSDSQNSENLESSSENASGTSSIYNLTEDEFNSATGYGTIAIPFTADDVSSCGKVTSDGSDTCKWRFVINPDKSEETAKWLMESISFIDTSQVPVDFDTDQLICDASYDDDNNLETLSYSLKTVMTAEEEDLSATYHVIYSVIGTGDDVSVSVPDLSAYVVEANAEQEAAEKLINSSSGSTTEN